MTEIPEHYRYLYDKTAPKKRKKQPEGVYKSGLVKRLEALGFDVIPQNSLKMAYSSDGKKIYSNYKPGIFDVILLSKTGKFFEIDAKTTDKKTSKKHMERLNSIGFNHDGIGSMKDSQVRRLELLAKKGFDINKTHFVIHKQNEKEIIKKLINLSDI